MRVFLIDDEQPCLDELSWQLSQYPDIEIAGTFTHPLKAAQAIENDRPDAVFLDIDMPHMSGLELAQKIQEKYTGVIILFVTAYEKYALDAYQSYPLDFLVKPVPDKRLIDTVSHLRRQYALLHPGEEKRDGLKIRCFGSFEILSDSAARFPTRRVKELLLYLIDRRGVAATRGELLDALFEGKSDPNTLNNLYVTLSRLKTLLDCWDNSRALIRLTEDKALMIAPGVCDYTDFMRFAKQNAALSAQNAWEAARALTLGGRIWKTKPASGRLRARWTWRTNMSASRSPLPVPTPQKGAPPKPKTYSARCWRETRCARKDTGRFWTCI